MTVEYTGANATWADVVVCHPVVSVGAEDFEVKCKTTGCSPAETPEEELKKSEGAKRSV